MSDMRDRIIGDENAFQKLAELIPGFNGYREREIRRAADRLLRDHLVGLLDATRTKAERIMRDVGTSNLPLVGKLGTMQRRLTALRDRVDHADYGYTGFFDAVKIGNEQLDRMYDYDMSLMGHIADMDATVTKMQGAEADAYDDLLDQLGGQMDVFAQMLDHRDEAVRGLSFGDQ